MSKLQKLLGRYTGTTCGAPVARGVRAMYNMECGGGGAYNMCKDCSDPNDCDCDCDCVYDDDDNH